MVFISYKKIYKKSFKKLLTIYRGDVIFIYVADGDNKKRKKQLLTDFVEGDKLIKLLKNKMIFEN
ncbi:hypothetical protein COJ46_17945 [Bacillus sp. AFS077874]